MMQMSGEGRYYELLMELSNELSCLQKLRLRAAKQHQRVRTNVIETFDRLLQTLSERRDTLLDTLSSISEQMEEQLSHLEATVSDDVTRLQRLAQQEREGEVTWSENCDGDLGLVYQSILTNSQKRSLARQSPLVSFQTDPHFLAKAPLVGSITRSQGVLAAESIPKALLGLSHGLEDLARLARAPDGNFYLLDTGENLIHLVAPEGELLHTVALHRSTRLAPINQFYHHADRFYVTSSQASGLKVFQRNGQLLHSLSRVGHQALAAPHGMGHTSKHQLVVANTARHCLLVCQHDLSAAVSIGEHPYQPHTSLPSPKFLAVDGNDCIYAVSSQHNTLFVLTPAGDLLYEMAVRDLPHPIRSLELSPAGDLLIHTSSHSKRAGAAGTALCLLRPGLGLVERLRLKGLTRTRVSDLCVTGAGAVVLSPEGSTQLMLLSKDTLMISPTHH